MTFRLAVLLLFSVTIGCGGGGGIESSRTALTGKVTLEDQPLRGGSITLISAADPDLRVRAMIRGDGTFTVADAPKGPVKVAVETESLKLGAPPQDYIAIPPRYGNPDTSELTADIHPGGEPLEIRLAKE